MNVKLEAGQRLHFIGIGGVGMSAIAKVLIERGLEVSGSDLKPSHATVSLQAMGARVGIGHDPSAVEGADAVVTSSAIPKTNAEVARAIELGIPIVPRGQALAAVLADLHSIVVAGTHGKTTTTSMIVSVLSGAGLDPTYLVGGGLNDAGTNARFGRGPLAVAESDESDGSFLLLRPNIAVVTNIEADHLDYWGSLEAVRDGFRRFVTGVPNDGAVIVPAGETRLVEHLGDRKAVTFGRKGVISSEDVVLDPQGARFTLVAGDVRVPVRLRVAGAHNVSNALACAAACLEAGLSVEDVAHHLGSFRGVERRFQVRGRTRGVTVIDDYAHHPTEVRANLETARAGPWERIVAVFQPHRYSRTASFARDFGGAFVDADRVVITDVYGAGEQPVPGVSGKLVADAVCDALPGRPVAYLPHRDELLSYLQTALRPGDALLTLGAGDISAVGEEVLADLRQRRS
jgi:UDP-N-acetylmuramate--alanine ligase